jgi:tubulin-specific chaperone A
MESNRKLKIQIGIIKRLMGDIKYYEEEVKENKAHIEFMKVNGECPYDIRKQEEVLSESYMMIPESRNRLETALQTFKSVVTMSECEEDIDKDLLEIANNLLEMNNYLDV